MPVGTAPVRNPRKEYKSWHGGDYTFEQVISDLTDNSIDANAANVLVVMDDQDLPDEEREHDCLSGKRNFFVLISDDGIGITQENIVPILSRGFERDYDEIELGAYGVGLKDSSLAQAYEVSVFSKTSTGCAFGRLSSCLVKRHNLDNIFLEDDLDDWMTKTQGFQLAADLTADKESGTVILLEGLHKVELEIGDGERNVWLNEIKRRAQNYLRMVFHRYIEGINVMRANSTFVEKNIKIHWGGDGNILVPLDPMHRNRRDGSQTGALCLEKKFPAYIDGNVRETLVRAWLIPHEDAYADQKGINGEIASTKRANAIGDMQGFYVYRNERLVEFANTDDPWKGILSRNDHHNQFRWEVHLPAGRILGEGKTDFSVNTSKSEVKIHKRLTEQFKTWSRTKDKWHPDDAVPLTMNQRSGTKRNGNETWDDCKYCAEFGLEKPKAHTFTACTHRTKCMSCSKKLKSDEWPNKHGLAGTCAKCKASMPKAKSKPLSTAPSLVKPALAEPVSEDSPKASFPQPAPPSKQTYLPVSGKQPATPNDIVVKRASKGPVINISLTDSEPIVEVNEKHEHYTRIRDALVKFFGH